MQVVRNSVALTVCLLFSVACFFTVHEHFAEDSSSLSDERRAEQHWTNIGKSRV